MKRSLGVTVVATLGLALLLAGLVIWLVHHAAARQRIAVARVSRARQRLGALDALSDALTEADAFRCAYAVRGEPGARDRCTVAIGAVRQRLEELQQLFEGETDRRLVEIETLARQNLTLLERSLQLRQGRRFNDRGQSALTRELLTNAETFRRSLADRRAVEDSIQESQARAADADARTAPSAVNLGGLLALLALSLTVALVGRDLVDRGREKAALRQSQLRTEERLAELSTRASGLEERIVQSQRLVTLGRLTGGVAHDFNNLLTVIVGCGEASLRNLPEGDPAREHIGVALKASAQAAVLTRQLLTVGRSRSGPLDLNGMVAEMEPLLRRLVSGRIEVVVALGSEVSAVAADRGVVEQTLLNLVANARDAMPDGGKLQIETSLARNTTRAETVLTVADTGCGMAAETKRRLFEPFFTTKGERGTGLGMAVVHDAIDRCGGRIEVDSELGRGTVVRVYFPLADNPTALRADDPHCPSRLDAIGQ